MKIPITQTKLVRVISQIDLAKAFMYLVIATPATLNKNEQIMLIITAVNKYGLEQICSRYTEGL